MPPPRDPELTRQHILQVTAEEMRLNGYKAASLAEILDKAGVSKGALYHHFANKQELGYAVFDEIFVKDFLSDWALPMSSDRPIDAVCEWFSGFAEQLSEEDLQLGCPVCNIATEMAGVDEGFRLKTMTMFEELQSRLARTIVYSQEKGQVKLEVDAEPVSAFIVAAIHGSMMQGKCGRNVDAFKSSLKCLSDYISSLKV